MTRPLTAALVGLISIGLIVPGCEKPTEDVPAPVPAPTPDEVVTSPDPATPLPEGLVVEDVEIGEGEACPEGALVTVEYVAMLSDRTVWDSTEKRKRSMEWDLSSPNLITGLRRGVPGMRIGGRRTVIIPSELAYGKTGRPPIPPNENLIFEITLLEWTTGSE